MASIVAAAAFYNDPFFRSTLTLALSVANNDDGDVKALPVRPYRSFDDRRSAGVRLSQSTRVQPLFDRGDLSRT